jgi:hypothetical protein
MNNISPRTLIISLIALLAALLVLVGYYWVHKPLDGASALLYGGILLDLGTALIVIAVSAAAGRAVLQQFARRAGLAVTSDDNDEDGQGKPRPYDHLGLNRAESIALSGGIGIALFSIIALVLGMVGLYNRFAFIAVLVLLAILCRKSLASWLSDIFGLVRAITPNGSLFTLFLIIFCMFLLALAALHAVKPPYEWDGMVYHLVEPLHAIQTGRLTANADNFYLGFPKAAELLYGVAMSLFGRDTAAAPVHFGIGVLALLAAAGLARRLAGVTAGWLAVALLLGSFNVWQLFGWAYVDLALALYAALIFLLLCRWREADHAAWLALIGILAGFGFGVKYTFGSMILAIAITIVILQPRRAVRNLVIFGAAAAIGYAPWAMRGLILYGNPIYPYFLGGLNWNSFRTEAFSQAGRGMIFRDKAWELLFLPVTATIFGQDYGETYSFTLGPFLLLLPLLFLLTWGKLDQRVRHAVIIGVLLLIPIYVYWATTAALTGIAMQTRLVIMILPISAILGAAAVVRLKDLPEKPIDLSFMFRAILVFTLSLSAIGIISKVNETRLLDVVFGRITEDEFLFRQLATYPVTMGRLDDLPDGSQVRFLWEPRGYYCPPDLTCLPDVLFDQWGNPRRQGITADEIFAGWRAAGDDYVLLFNLGRENYLPLSYTPDFDRELPDAIAASLQPVWTTDDGRYTLYTWGAEQG